MSDMLSCLLHPIQGDDDLQDLLHDLSSSPTLPESTALIWGSSEEVGADARPGSSCSGSILQPDSPMADSQVRKLMRTQEAAGRQARALLLSARQAQAGRQASACA